MIEPTASPGSGESCSQAATAWVARLASRNATREDLRGLREWLAADPQHEQAFDEARRLWIGLAPIEEPLARTLPRKRQIFAAAVAAAACLVLAVIAPSVVSHDLVADVGEVRETVLSDGSRIWLDSGAAVDFHEIATSRTLKLARGRVHIAVALDHGRPFQVEAAGAVIRDIGTAFTVDAEGELHVAVAEGAVEVTLDGTSTSLVAGREATFLAHAVPELVSFQPNAEAAWRKGRIVFNRTTLAEALRQVDRYRAGKIVLLDAAAGQRPVSGSISIHDLEGGLDSLANSESLRLVHLPHLLIVTSR